MVRSSSLYVKMVPCLIDHLYLGKWKFFQCLKELGWLMDKQLFLPMLRNGYPYGYISNQSGYAMCAFMAHCFVSSLILCYLVAWFYYLYLNQWPRFYHTLSVTQNSVPYNSPYFGLETMFFSSYVGSLEIHK